MKSPSLDWNRLAELAQRITGPARPPGEIDLGDRDLYLSMAPEEMFDIYGIGTHAPAVGSLQDDLAQLQKLLDDPQRTVTPVDLERLGNVLRAVSLSATRSR